MLSPKSSSLYLAQIIVLQSCFACNGMSDDTNLDSPEIAARIERSGGRVIRDDEEPTRPVTEVRFVGKAPDPELLDQLARLPKLSTLCINKCAVPDATMKHLGGLRHLETLSLYRAEATERGFGYLKVITTLQDLRLDRSNITDVGLDAVGAIESLQWLSLADTTITDDSLKRLVGLRSLGTLDLDGTKVGDDGLRYIGRLIKVQDLSLYNTRVTDKGLVHLRTLMDLQWLELGNTRGPRGNTGISDDGLEELKNFRTLFHLGLWGTRVTFTGVQKFHQSLPTCFISSPYGDIKPKPVLIREEIPGTLYWRVLRKDEQEPKPGGNSGDVDSIHNSWGVPGTKGVPRTAYMTLGGRSK